MNIRNGEIVSHRVIGNKLRLNDPNAVYAPYGKTAGETVKNMRVALFGNKFGASKRETDTMSV